MHVPLDYYRILGLPLQATPEQLQQAHHDRSRQLPQRDYNDMTIGAYRELIDQAFKVLVDPAQRQHYDALLLSSTPPVADPLALPEAAPEELLVPDQDEVVLPEIEIEDTQVTGALAILLELGEYELVLHLGVPYLNRGALPWKQVWLEQADQVFNDIVLTVAIAYLELGREQWQQQQYEHAAQALEAGQTLLSQENLFPNLQREIQSELDKLCPYRILEILAQPETHIPQRQEALQLLQAMLDRRGGIEGRGQDGSGLDTDAFLRFIQQLRDYLTTEEQQSIFVSEARRPSGVATYLAVYALLARGFIEFQPTLIHQAKQFLLRLSSRQDIYLELAVCTLLLGQTEQALEALDLSEEYEVLALIREHSQGQPDLLPGLCFYAERWLQTEVFPHFRDLRQGHFILKDYFADQVVQAYLETLPNEPAHFRAKASPQHATPIGLSHRYSPLTAQDLQRPLLESASSAREPTLTATDSSSRSSGAVAVLSPPTNGSIPPAHASISQPPTLRSNRSELALTKQGFQPWLLSLLGGLMLVGAGFAAIAYRWVANPPEELPDLALETPVIELPTLPTPASTPLTPAGAQQVIETWLQAKAQAFGPDYDLSQMQQILMNPLLTNQLQRAQATQQEQGHWQYEHQVKINQVRQSDRNRAIIDAEVNEKADFFRQGKVIATRSYHDTNLHIRYSIVRQDQNWRIRDIVVKSP